MHLSFSIASINEREKILFNAHPTHESQEYDLMRSYEKALEKMDMKKNQDAYLLFQSILSHPISTSASLSERGLNFSPIIQIKYLSLKNLGELLLEIASEEEEKVKRKDEKEEALDCFLQALEIDDSDCLLCYRAASIACEFFRLYLSRKLLEHCLLLNPRHWGCLNKLLMVLGGIGDEPASISLAKRILSLSPTHPHALQTLQSSRTYFLLRPNLQNPNPIAENTEFLDNTPIDEAGTSGLLSFLDPSCFAENEKVREMTYGQRQDAKSNLTKNDFLDCKRMDAETVGNWMNGVDKGGAKNGYLLVTQWELLNSKFNADADDGKGGKSRLMNRNMHSFLDRRKGWKLDLAEVSWKGFASALLQQFRKMKDGKKDDSKMKDEKEEINHANSKCGGLYEPKFLFKGKNIMEFDFVEKDDNECDEEYKKKQEKDAGNISCQTEKKLEENVSKFDLASVKQTLPLVSSSFSPCPESNVQEEVDVGIIRSKSFASSSSLPPPSSSLLPSSSSLPPSSSLPSEVSKSHSESIIEVRNECREDAVKGVDEATLKEIYKELTTNRPRTRLHHAQEKPNLESRLGPKQIEKFDPDRIGSILEAFVVSAPANPPKDLKEGDNEKSNGVNKKNDIDDDVVRLEKKEEHETHALAHRKQKTKKGREEVMDFMKKHRKNEEDICVLALDFLETMAKKYDELLDEDLIQNIIRIEKDHLPCSFRKSSFCSLFLSEIYAGFFSMSEENQKIYYMQEEADRCMNEIMEDIILSTDNTHHLSNIIQKSGLDRDMNGFNSFSEYKDSGRGRRVGLSKMFSGKRKGEECWMKCESLKDLVLEFEEKNEGEGEDKGRERKRKRRKNNGMDLGFGLWKRSSMANEEPKSVNFKKNEMPLEQVQSSPAIANPKALANAFQDANSDASWKITRAFQNRVARSLDSEAKSNVEPITEPNFELKTNAKLAMKSDSEAESNVEPITEPNSEPKTNAKLAMEPDSKPDSVDFWIRFHWNWGCLFFVRKETERGRMHFQLCKRIFEQCELNSIGKEKVIRVLNSKLHDKLSKSLVIQKLTNMDLEHMISYAEKKTCNNESLDPQVLNQLSKSLFSEETFAFKNETVEGEGKHRMEEEWKTLLDENVSENARVFEYEKEMKAMENAFANLEHSVELKWKSAKMILHHFYTSSFSEFDFKLVLFCHLKILNLFLRFLGEELLHKDKIFLLLSDEWHSEFKFVKKDWKEKKEGNETEIRNEMNDIFAKELSRLCYFSNLLHKCNERLPVAPLASIQRTLICCMQYFLHSCLSQVDDLPKCLASESVVVDIALSFCQICISDQQANAAQQISVLDAMHNLLGHYGLCCKSNQIIQSKGIKCTFLHMAIQHLTVLYFQSHSLSPSNSEKPSSGAEETVEKEEKEKDMVAVKEKEEKEEGKCQEIDVDEWRSEGEEDMDERRKEWNIDFHLEQCFYCLFGIRLKLFNESSISSSMNMSMGMVGMSSGNHGEGLKNHKNARMFSFNNKKQCAHFLHHLLPFALSFPKFQLVRLRKLILDLFSKFPSPPCYILSQKSMEYFLNDVDFNESLLLSHSFHSLLSNIKRIYDLNKIRNNHGGSASPSLSACEDVEYAEKEKENVQNLVFDSINKQSKLENKEKEIVSMKVEKDNVSHENKKDDNDNREEDGKIYEEVYKNLYFLLTEVENMSASNEWGGFILSQEGLSFMQKKTKLFIFDLCFNPNRFKSWMNLGNLYREEYELLLNDGSKQYSVENWRKEMELDKRVEGSYRRSYRCILRALSLTNEKNTRADCEEACAFLHYSRIQNVAPLYDAISSNLMHDEKWIDHCQQALSHFYAAASLSESWLHYLYIAKLKKKLHFSFEEVFASFSAAMKMNASSLDVFYYLHSYRLKLLCEYKNKKPLKLMKLIASHCYVTENSKLFNELIPSFSSDANSIDSDSDVSTMQPTNQETSNQVPLNPRAGDSTGRSGAADPELPPEVHKKTTIINESNRENAWNVLFDDAIAAMNSCMEGELKHFHKARYRKAAGLVCKDQPQDILDAKNELSFLFSTSKSAFCVNVWEIQGKKRIKGKSSTKQDGKISKEIYLSESSRKFTTCVRKYLLMYLQVCRKVNDFQTLLRCYSNLKMDKKFCHSLGDIAMLSLGYYVTDLLNEMELSSSAKDTSAQVSVPSTSNSCSKEASPLFHSLEVFAMEIMSEHAGNWQNTVIKSLVKSSLFSQQQENKIYKAWILYLTHVYSCGELASVERVVHRMKRKWNRPSKSAMPYVFAIWNDLVATWHATLSHFISKEFSLLPHDIRQNPNQNASNVQGKNEKKDDHSLPRVSTLQSSPPPPPSFDPSFHFSSFFSPANASMDLPKDTDYRTLTETVVATEAAAAVEAAAAAVETVGTIGTVGTETKTAVEASTLAVSAAVSAPTAAVSAAATAAALGVKLIEKKTESIEPAGVDHEDRSVPKPHTKATVDVVLKCNSENSISFLKSARALWNEISSGPFALFSYPSVSSQPSTHPSFLSPPYPIKFLWPESCCSFSRPFDGRVHADASCKPDKKEALGLGRRVYQSTDQVREPEPKNPEPVEKLIEKAFMLVHGRFPCEKELMQFKDDHSKSKPLRLRNVALSNKSQQPSQAPNLSDSQKNPKPVTAINSENSKKSEKRKIMDEVKAPNFAKKMILHNNSTENVSKSVTTNTNTTTTLPKSHSNIMKPNQDSGLTNSMNAKVESKHEKPMLMSAQHMVSKGKMDDLLKSVKPSGPSSEIICISDSE